ncbi:MAG: gliding motility-associated C-terminal domain-containing protein [Flavobacteriales bacterium]|nr:gliding motility-associated C-terminal domain-containing protein [Flavobacteriales bacterium]
MKRLSLFILAIGCLGTAMAQNVNYTVEIVNFQQTSCNDGAGADEEPTWKTWATDNHTTVGSFTAGTWVGGACHFVDGNIPIAYNPGGSLLLFTEINSDATILDLKFDAWEDDCDGGSGSSRCSFSSSCLLGLQEDDCREQATISGFNFRDSSMCEWHTINYSQGAFAWGVRFNWEYTIFDAGPLVQEVCGDSIVMSGQGSGQWTITAGGTGGFSDNLDPTTTFGGVVAGSPYTLQWATLPNCITPNSQDIQVNLNALPLPNIATTATVFCEFSDLNFTASNGVTYDWSVNTGSNVVVNDTTTGAFALSNLSLSDSVVYVYATDANGCIGVDSITFTVEISPSVNIGNDTTICAGASLFLDANDSILFTGYAWNTGETTTSLNITAPGQYIVVLTHTNSCTSSDTINVGQYAPLNLNLGGGQLMCLGDSILLDAGSGFVSYLWDDGSTNQTNTFYAFGTYNVIVTDTNNCTESDSVLINPDTFFYTIGSDTTISLGATIDLTANPGISYLWSNSDTTQTISAAPIFDETFTATTLLANGCYEVGSINVLINEDLNIFVPNMFSPNGDASNDLFLVYGFGIAEVDFRIYNRWGGEVWNTSDINELQLTGWDGTFNGEDQPTGTYVWKMTGTTVDGAAVSFQGNNNGTLLLRR